MDYTLLHNTVRLQSINQYAPSDESDPDYLDYSSFKDFLQELLDYGCLSDDTDRAAEGVVKLVLSKGLSSLKPLQEEVMQKYVLDKYTMVECPECFTELGWEEMYEATTSGCPHCEHIRERMLRD